MKHIAIIIGLLITVSGWVLAKGFWSTFFAVIFFPYSWYLVAEKLLQVNHWLGF